MSVAPIPIYSWGKCLAYYDDGWLIMIVDPIHCTVLGGEWV